MKHIVGIGDSHIHAVSDAIQEVLADHPGQFRYTKMCLLDAPYRPSFSDVQGVKVPNPDWVAALRAVFDSGDDVSIFLYLGGSDYYRWSLTPGEEPFDFVEPGQEDNEPLVGDLIPYDLVKTRVHEALVYVPVVIDFLRTMTDLPLVQVCPPPPTRDLLPHLRNVPELLTRIEQYGISPLRFRARVWRLTNQMFARICAEHNVDCLDCSPEAIMPDGALRDDLIGDGFHANVKWGHLVARRLLERCRLTLREGTNTHPYASLPDHCFWRRSISPVPMEQVDPVVEGKFRIGRTDRVATAGSCFAQHIARHLSNAGFNYFVTESVNAFVPQYIATDYNYGVFTARYGNIYTTRQFLQLLRRVYGEFTPTDDIWVGKDGRFYDPYRPQIQPGGFTSEQEFRLDREKHFAAIRRAVEQCNVFVFTLGLTEAWTNREDGAVYPLCPGTAAGVFDAEKHLFVNFRMTEVLADLDDALNFIRRRNLEVRFMLTVSPVALLATAENRHVLVSTTYSKSVLRTVCGELDAQYPDVAYFPSYEVITGSFNRGAYFAPDMREVTESGVSHVMRLFMTHYAEQNNAAAGEIPATEGSETASLARDIEHIVNVICDEEALDRRQ